MNMIKRIFTQRQPKLKKKLPFFLNLHVPVPFLFDDWFVHACEDGVCAHFVLICWVSGSTFRALTPRQIQQLHFTGRGGNLVEFKGVGRGLQPAAT